MKWSGLTACTVAVKGTPSQCQWVVNAPFVVINCLPAKGTNRVMKRRSVNAPKMLYRSAGRCRKLLISHAAFLPALITSSLSNIPQTGILQKIFQSVLDKCRNPVFSPIIIQAILGFIWCWYCIGEYQQCRIYRNPRSCESRNRGHMRNR